MRARALAFVVTFVVVSLVTPLAHAELKLATLTVKGMV